MTMLTPTQVGVWLLGGGGHLRAAAGRSGEAARAPRVEVRAGTERRVSYITCASVAVAEDVICKEKRINDGKNKMKITS